ncbi:MAG: ABC transporter ATP-binding protein [Candidatus Gastranaerophilales bacterium]|nr:ABC transporter ATP-binding protein [Candidatus Gastranaerophilales bacterium]
MSILKIENLNLSFNFQSGTYQALHNVNLDLNKGETLAIVGESGCGKTLTAMSILGLIPNTATITEGKIIFQNDDLLKLNDSQLQKIRGKKIALIPQDPMTSLNPLYTIGNQLLEVIHLHQNLKGKEAKQKAIEALELVKIPNAKERLKNYPHEFSGGMRQRVIIAMAIACNAEIIIADEPTTALDVTVQAQIMELLKEIQNKYQTSIILISHDLGLVCENSNKIAVMYAGSVVEYATNSELFKAPKHPYTKSLLKSLPDLHTTNLETIKGQPPSIRDEIIGCPFAERCNQKLEKCTKQKPPLHQINQDSATSCWLYEAQ